MIKKIKHKKLRWHYPEYDNGKNKGFGIGCYFLYKGWLFKYADAVGLDSKENSGCHVNLSLYYKKNFAKTISFSSFEDARAFVEQEGKIELDRIKRDYVEQKVNQ